MAATLKVVERRRRAPSSPIRVQAPVTPGPDALLGQWHKAAIAMYDIRRSLEVPPESQDPLGGQLALGLLEMPLESDDSIIAMNKRLIQERNALMQQKEMWQVELQGQHDSLQEVLLATRQLKLKLQAQATLDGLSA
ncbi:hypothetical protein SPRG_13447 [Saprolegnia parasitica CBS 223.65]|uniref:Uncharacterized protein n=1 Tax=Saprolegnia parasitica (strain CBS 223.65) TaxID=695850 RepID=A0A067C085_SAPPC|nr:hypothetical protein SPRG_13447 [Saprolegnia parasitica CBS 223.65]KDO20192.1 hypothetical protein SPRG_13447 [Saprolegnia parasitica CBS 223.65]|eukprot:XP_012209080.1 hypothetical protein SPRG_13447 [Saprolegnia parasitica CBS 223.65]